jgi:hypothetical protein
VTLLDQLNRVSDDVSCFLFSMRSKEGGWSFVPAEAAKQLSLMAQIVGRANH